MKILHLLFIGVAASYLIYRRLAIKQIEVNYIGLQQNELTQQSTLLDQKGNLAENGWARQPIKSIQLDQFTYFNRILRFKQWDYYHFATKNIYFGIAIADLGYVQTIQFQYYNFAKNQFIADELLLLPFIDQKMVMGNTPNDSIHYKITKSFSVSVEYDQHIKQIHLKYGDLELKATIMANIRNDAIVMMVPFNEDGSQFYYNYKAYNWDISGSIVSQGEKHVISQASAGVDWGRGVWPYDTYWLWMSGQGIVEGIPVSVNLGGGFQHISCRATEESIFIGDQMYKLRDLVYNFDQNDYSKPITVHSVEIDKETLLNRNGKNGDLWIEFVPAYVNHKEKELILIKIDLHQLIGRFLGYYQNGETLQKIGIVGIVDFNKSKW